MCCSRGKHADVNRFDARARNRAGEKKIASIERKIAKAEEKLVEARGSYAVLLDECNDHRREHLAVSSPYRRVVRWLSGWVGLGRWGVGAQGGQRREGTGQLLPKVTKVGDKSI